jgi:NAD(P)-dependent dehydrogenase (short-subunit alcohol dehydrogenase family)
LNTGIKIALITGGSRGLGKNMALAIARKGLDVVITYNTYRDAADAVVAEIQSTGQKAFALQLDTSNVNLFDDFIKKVTSHLQSIYGKPYFDFLITNAGTALYHLAKDTTEDQFDAIVNIHFKGVFFLTQKAIYRLIVFRLISQDKR